MRTSVDVVIPILDEERTLAQQVGVARRFLDGLSDEWDARLVIADNGSKDASPRIGAELEATLRGVHYMRVGERGVGRALKHAWTRSDASIVGYMDLDLATDLAHLPEALALLRDGSDVVTGSRLAKGARVEGRTLTRAITTRVFNRLVRSYLKTGFTDGMCGFKFLHRRHVEALIERGARSDGWFFATELLVCAEHMGLRVADLPVHWRDDPDSRVRLAKLTAEYLRAMRTLKRQLAV